MITRVFSALALTALFTSAAAAQNAAAIYLTLQPNSRLWVEGTSTVRGFSCEAATLGATVEASSSNAVAATFTGEKVVRAVALEVPARGLDCDNGTMNGHMYKALKADQHATIVFNLSSYDLVLDGTNATVVTITGSLVLGGQEKAITMSAHAQPGPDGTLQVSGTQDIRLTDFGLKPPSLMLGTMRVGDVVQVKYDLYLKH